MESAAPRSIFPAFPEDRPLIPASVRRRLRYCTVESERLSLERFPDFLIVGPQRTGTTWLHQVLTRHPEVFLTDPKEIFYFSRLKDGAANPRFESTLLDWYLAQFRPRWTRRVASQWRCLTRYGRPWRPLVRGEATASYAAMDADLVDEVAALRPGVKALFMVRHPVERAWSHAKKDLSRNRGRRAEDVTDDEWKAFFRDPYQLRCARYEENLATWRSRLGDAGVFVGTFEEVEESPERLLARVTAFLGVSGDERYVDPVLLRHTVNPTHGSEVPAKWRGFLEELLAAEIDGWARVVEATRARASQSA